jgi:hypothetical protein
MTCKICHSQTKKIFKAKILNKYLISYFLCDFCGFLRTEEPYWLEEVYKNPINISDTGYLQRNLYLSQITTIILYFFGNDKKYLDYAGGYGVFVRLMRDIGFDFYWYDKYTKNIFAKGFEYNNEMQPVEAITTFESFEHFANPLEEIENMLKISKNIIFTTELLPQPIPAPEEWWYYGLDHGQHISFYSKKTLFFLAKHFCLNYYNLGKLHVLTKRNIIKYIKYILKLKKIGLYKLICRNMRSKTWDDYLKMSKEDENTI